MESQRNTSNVQSPKRTFQVVNDSLIPMEELAQAVISQTHGPIPQEKTMQ